VRSKGELQAADRRPTRECSDAIEYRSTRRATTLCVCATLPCACLSVTDSSRIIAFRTRLWTSRHAVMSSSSTPCLDAPQLSIFRFQLIFGFVFARTERPERRAFSPKVLPIISSFVLPSSSSPSSTTRPTRAIHCSPASCQTNTSAAHSSRPKHRRIPVSCVSLLYRTASSSMHDATHT
jgi:hypothetical protein